MAARTQRTERRADALSKARIVETAIHILDTEGEAALTFRALAARLATGSGAIYWHVADKGELLAAAADDILGRVLGEADASSEPHEAIRTIALGIFDTIDAHPWVGAQLSRAPWQPASLKVYEAIGGQLLALGVPERAEFDAWSVLVNYILGVAVQNAANARQHPVGTDRSALLADFTARWTQLDPAKYPFGARIATRLREHDDREQFLAGLDLILAGIATLR